MSSSISSFAFCLPSHPVSSSHQNNNLHLKTNAMEVVDGPMPPSSPSARPVLDMESASNGDHHSLEEAGGDSSPASTVTSLAPVEDGHHSGPLPPLASPSNLPPPSSSPPSDGHTRTIIMENSSNGQISQQEDESPATVISLAPAQPAYDISGAVQYVYLTTTADYSAYRDYYPTSGTTTQLQLQPVTASPVTSAGGTTIVHHPSNGVDPYHSSSNTVTTLGPAGVVPTVVEGTSFLDRYLRQPPVTLNNSSADLPSPDSGIGEASHPPSRAGENGNLSQVRIK